MTTVSIEYYCYVCQKIIPRTQVRTTWILSIPYVHDVPDDQWGQTTHEVFLTRVESDG